MPARRSNASKAARNTLRPARVRDIAAGERLVAAPPPPAGIDPAAAAEWRRLAPLLVEVGTLTAADLRALQLLAETLASAAHLAATVKAEGYTVPGAAGGVKSHPCLVALSQARAQARALLADFGLSPRSRGGVDAAPDGSPPEDPAAAYFR